MPMVFVLRLLTDEYASTLTKFIVVLRVSLELVYQMISQFTSPFLTFGPSSEKLKQDLLTLLSKYYSKYKFCVILVNNFTILSFFNYKDKLPLHLRYSLVYKYSCVHCTSEYVGMTTRTLGTRVAQHAGISFRTGVPLTSPPHSAVRDHSELCSTNVDINNFKVLANSSSEINLKILESLHIFKSRPGLNRQLSSYLC